MAGAFSGEMKNAQMEAAGAGTAPGTTYAKYVTIASATSLKPENSAGPKELKKAAHGLNTYDIVFFKELSGGTGLVVGRPYYVRKVSTSVFELFWTRKDAEKNENAIEFSTEVKEAGTTLIHLIEHTGAKTKRKATAFGAASKGVVTDAAREVEASSEVTIEYSLFWTEETSTENKGFCGYGELPKKTIGEGDIYKITESKLEDLGAA